MLGVATLGFACWRNHLPLKYGMYLVVYLVHMSARFPMASKRGVREQARTLTRPQHRCLLPLCVLLAGPLSCLRTC